MWRHDKSWAENFLTVCTPVLLGFMAVTSLLLRFVRDPISCHYVYPQANDYFTDHCFDATSVILRSEEFVKYSQQVWTQRPQPKDLNPFEVWPKQRIYHQWVPFALGVGAIVCFIPYVIWHVLSALLWLDRHVLLKTLSDNQSHASAGRHVTLKNCALIVQAGLKGGNWVLTAAALGRKGLACVVCVLQLVLILVWFEPPLGGGGPDGKRDLTSVNVTVPEVLEDVPLPVDPFFCTVKFTQRQNVQTMTMQCLLPLNKVFTKAFIFLFYFFLVLLVLCSLDVFSWLGRLLLPRLRDVTLLRNLSVLSQSESGRSSYDDPAHYGPFLQALGADGRLLLAEIGDHCGPMVTLDFTHHLWQAFKGPASPRPRSSTPSTLGSAPRTSAQEEAMNTDIPLQQIGEVPSTTDDRAKLYNA